MDNKHCLIYLKQLLKNLSNDAHTQQQSIPKEISWNAPSDIANEWDYDNIRYFVEKLQNNDIISDSIVQGIKAICDNFDKVSKNGAQFDQTTWTIDGILNHPFWERQRQLARHLLNELNKVAL